MEYWYPILSQIYAFYHGQEGITGHALKMELNTDEIIAGQQPPPTHINHGYSTAHLHFHLFFLVLPFMCMSKLLPFPIITIVSIILFSTRSDRFVLVKVPSETCTFDACAVLTHAQNGPRYRHPESERQ